MGYGILLKGRHAFLKLFVMFQVFMWSLLGEMSECSAANKLSVAANNLTDDMKAFTSTVLWAAMVVGIGLIIMGAVKLTKREGEGGLGKALMFIIAGVLAVGIPALIKLAGGSLLDSNEAGQGAVGGVSGAER